MSQNRGVSLLEQITADFLILEGKLQPLLAKIDFLARLSERIGVVDPDLLAAYVYENNPVRKYKNDADFVDNSQGSRNVKQIEGFLQANDFISHKINAHESLNISDLEKLNKILMGYTDCSEYSVYLEKRCQIYIGSESSPVIIYRAANPEDFGALMDFISHIINSKPDIHPLLQAALVHYLLILVHLFKDGNGRTARQAATYVMKKNKYDLIHPIFQQYYIWDKVKHCVFAAHYNITKECGDFYLFHKNNEEWKKWVEYFLQSIARGYQKLIITKCHCKIIQFRSKLLGREIKKYFVLSPAPPGVPLKIDRQYIRKSGPVEGQWAYTDINGNVIAWRVRFRGTRKSGYKKTYLFFQYYSDNTWQKSLLQHEGKLPIYKLHKLLEPKGKIYLICEGEKSSDAAAQLLKEPSYYTLSWALGSYNVDSTDWKPLGHSGAEVYIWRDNDEPGKLGQETLCKILAPYGNKIHVLSDDAFVGRPEKWDAADALAEGMKPEEAEAFIKQYMVPYIANSSDYAASA